MQVGLDTDNIDYEDPIFLSCCRVKLRYPSRQYGVTLKGIHNSILTPSKATAFSI